MTVIQQLAAAGVAVDALLIVAQQDTEYNASTTLATHPELQFLAAPNSVYMVEWGLKSNCNNNGGVFNIATIATVDQGAGFNVSYPMSTDDPPQANTLLETWLLAASFGSTPKALSDALSETNTTETDLQSGRAIIAIGSPGATLAVKYRGTNTNVLGVQVRAGSWLRYQRLQ